MLGAPRTSSDNILGMRHITGGVFTAGSERFYPEERPLRKVRVDPFWIDETPVTNTQFAEFVAATGYKTCAETAPDPADYPGMPPYMAQPGSLVFERPSHPVGLDDCRRWWSFVFNADWRRPLGPGSSIARLEDHPVVHVAYADALTYATWAGKDLPTEAEWEFAARGGLEAADFAWGSELSPGGAMLANYWQGQFPFENQMLDGWERTSPVRHYPPNGFGLFDMIGNVWELTSDWFATPRISDRQKGACCVPLNPRGGTERESYDPQTTEKIGRIVLKGGSHLCAPNYCQRYRPAARFAQPLDTSTGHVGFRCIIRSGSANYFSGS